MFWWPQTYMDGVDYSDYVQGSRKPEYLVISKNLLICISMS